jgi:hypothetical protein
MIQTCSASRHFPEEPEGRFSELASMQSRVGGAHGHAISGLQTASLITNFSN